MNLYTESDERVRNVTIAKPLLMLSGKNAKSMLIVLNRRSGPYRFILHIYFGLYLIYLQKGSTQ